MFAILSQPLGTGVLLRLRQFNPSAYLNPCPSRPRYIFFFFTQMNIFDAEEYNKIASVNSVPLR